MTYAAPIDLIAKYGSLTLAKLTNEDPNRDFPDNDRLLFALSEASAEIDAHLGKCYSVPLTVVPSVIKFKTLILARYHLETGCDYSDKVQKQYKDTIEWLNTLCCGDCPPDIGIPKRARADTVAYYAQPRVFTRESLLRLR